VGMWFTNLDPVHIVTGKMEPPYLIFVAVSHERIFSFYFVIKKVLERLFLIRELVDA
jgi:hypothetical protein